LGFHWRKTETGGIQDGSGGGKKKAQKREKERLSEKGLDGDRKKLEGGGEGTRGMSGRGTARKQGKHKSKHGWREGGFGKGKSNLLGLPRERKERRKKTGEAAGSPG